VSDVSTEERKSSLRKKITNGLI